MPDSTVTGSGHKAKKHRTWVPQWLALAVAVLAIGSDQISKNFAIAHLGDGKEVPLLGHFLSLRLIRNPGAAFSFGSGQAWIFTLVSILVVGWIIYVVATTSDTVTAVLCGLLAGGAIGNIVDRFVQPPGMGQGHVVDFINYGGLFIGNLADVWIVLGVLAIAVLAFLGKVYLPGFSSTATNRHGEKTTPAAQQPPGEDGETGA